MEYFLVFLGVCMVPAILNMIFLFITVKFNLWNWISRFLFSENYKDKVNEDDVKRALIPFVSTIILLQIIISYIGTAIYYVVKYTMALPIIKVIDFFSNEMMNGFNRIEDKREFYNKLNNYNKK